MNRTTVSSLSRVFLIGIAFSCLYAFLIRPLGFLEIPILKMQDVFFSVRYSLGYHHAILNDIVLVSVDDETLEKVKDRWPFPRRTYAQILERMEMHKPKLIAFDFVFSGRGEPVDDFLLAEEFQKLGTVILAAFVDSNGNLVMSHRDIVDHAKASGIVNKLLDRDLQVRRAKLDYRDVKGRLVSWPWEIEVLIQHLGLDRQTFEMTKLSKHLAKKRIVRINFRLTEKDFKKIPLWKMIEGRDWESEVEGKLVFFGATSRFLHDDYQSPLGLMPGVVVNLNLFLNLLAKDFLHSIPILIDALFVLSFVFMACLLGLSNRFIRSAAVMVLSAVGFLALNFILFLNSWIGDFMTPVLGGWACFLAVSLYRYVHTMVENVQLRGKVVTDPLTGLYNRRVLEFRIEEELEKIASARGGRKTDPLYELSLLMIDIDNFKSINDKFGHQFGDDVLKNVGFAIKENTRKDDTVARYGGEEFCVVLAHTNKEEASQIAEKIRLSVASRKFNYVNQVATFTVSIGVAGAREDNLSASRALIRAADEALYEAKKTGKNKVICHHS